MENMDLRSDAAERQIDCRQDCRFCGRELERIFVDLGMVPLANSYLTSAQLNQMEKFYPLRVYVCELCLLVQAEEVESAESIFSNYAYFSSYSDSWVRHAKSYAEMALQRFKLSKGSLVVEIASNDGYMLQHFINRGIPVLGIEPARNVAEAALKKSIPTLVTFFNEAAAESLIAQNIKADLLLGNNVLAHVPNLNEFVRGMKMILNPQGVITMEFPHLARLIEEKQFDTIYHEHFSYFTFTVVEKIFAAHGLVLFDVEQLSTHGGSLRIYARHAEDLSKPVGENVATLRMWEKEARFDSIERYLEFSETVRETKCRILDLLIKLKRELKTIVGYGAPAKGNTLLNFCGIGSDIIDYTVDLSSYKQGRFLPGTHIPICHPDRIKETKPDYVFLLPWNLKDEIMEQMNYIRDWGGRFLVPIPEVRVL
jgi:2-polyprenyl-3-methyl-5-hydroxy-6-metoxy-1,4-benzoquinol methylase